MHGNRDPCLHEALESKLKESKDMRLGEGGLQSVG